MWLSTVGPQAKHGGPLLGYCFLVIMPYMAADISSRDVSNPSTDNGPAMVLVNILPAHKAMQTVRLGQRVSRRQFGAALWLLADARHARRMCHRRRPKTAEDSLVLKTSFAKRFPSEVSRVLDVCRLL